MRNAGSSSRTDVVEPPRLVPARRSSRCCRASDRRPTARWRPSRRTASMSARQMRCRRSWRRSGGSASTARARCADSARAISCSKCSGVIARADLHADRIRDAAEVLDVRAVELRGAHADPRDSASTGCTSAAGAAQTASAPARRAAAAPRGGEEVDAVRFVHRLAADGLEELERIADRLHERWYSSRERRVPHEVEVPVLRVMQVGEPAVDQRRGRSSASARRARSRAAAAAGPARDRPP